MVVSLVGWVLMRQITDGLVASKTEQAVAEATRGTLDAQNRLSGASGTDFDASTQLTQLASSIVARGAVQGYDVVLTGPIAGSSQAVAAGSGTPNTPGVKSDSVPERLRSTVERGTRSGTSWTYARIYVRALGGPPRRARDRDRVPADACRRTAAPTRCTTCSR